MEKEKLLKLLKKHGISPSLILDQNFMTDSGLIRKIVSLARIKPGETVLEIGSGIGSLTPEIAKKARKVIAVDIDKAFAPILRESCPKNVEIVTGNILKLIDGLKFRKIISNTPYSICEPLLQKLAGLDFDIAVLTLPKRFIERLKEGDSRLSLLANAFFRMEEKLEIPRQAFYPEPKVESGVLLLSPKIQSDYKREPCSYILKKLFLQEGRKLKNALRDALIDLHRDILGKEMTKNQAREIMQKLNIPGRTLETLVRDLKGKEIQGIEGRCRRFL